MCTSPRDACSPTASSPYTTLPSLTLDYPPPPPLAASPLYSPHYTYFPNNRGETATTPYQTSSPTLFNYHAHLATPTIDSGVKNEDTGNNQLQPYTSCEQDYSVGYSSLVDNNVQSDGVPITPELTPSYDNNKSTPIMFSFN